MVCLTDRLAGGSSPFSSADLLRCSATAAAAAAAAAASRSATRFAASGECGRWICSEPWLMRTRLSMYTGYHMLFVDQGLRQQQNTYFPVG